MKLQFLNFETPTEREFHLLSSFNAKSKLNLLKSIILNIHLIIPLATYVISLNDVYIKFDETQVSKLIKEQLEKTIWGIKFHKYAQAYLGLDGEMQDWIQHSSRRNLRKNIKKAQLNGLYSKIVLFTDMALEIETLEIERGGNLKGFWGNFPTNIDRNELVCAAVYSRDHSLKAVCIGSKSQYTAKIFAGISITRSDGARWLAKYALISHYSKNNVQNLLISDRIGVQKGNLEFQYYFGFKSVNLVV